MSSILRAERALGVSSESCRLAGQATNAHKLGKAVEKAIFGE
jgi:hypothetical protein